MSIWRRIIFIRYQHRTFCQLCPEYLRQLEYNWSTRYSVEHFKRRQVLLFTLRRYILPNFSATLGHFSGHSHYWGRRRTDCQTKASASNGYPPDFGPNSLICERNMAVFTTWPKLTPISLKFSGTSKTINSSFEISDWYRKDQGVFHISWPATITCPLLEIHILSPLLQMPILSRIYWAAGYMVS